MKRNEPNQATTARSNLSLMSRTDWIYYDKKKHERQEEKDYFFFHKLTRRRAKRAKNFWSIIYANFMCFKVIGAMKASWWQFMMNFFSPPLTSLQPSYTFSLSSSHYFCSISCSLPCLTLEWMNKLQILFLFSAW